MINLKMAGVAALLALAPVLMTSSADARPGGFRGGGGMAFHGGGFHGGPGFAGRGFAAAAPMARGWSGGGNWGHHWGGRRWIGPGVGFAAGLAAGAALNAPYYGGYYGGSYYDDSYAYYPAPGPDVTDSNGPADSDSVASCQQTYRSYDPASGTYLGYDGLRHPCP
ncbi:MAG: BA14K family protein [Pseudomonadota bacterium]